MTFSLHLDKIPRTSKVVNPAHLTTGIYNFQNVCMNTNLSRRLGRGQTEPVPGRERVVMYASLMAAGAYRPVIPNYTFLI